MEKEVIKFSPLVYGDTVEDIKTNAVIAGIEAFGSDYRIELKPLTSISTSYGSDKGKLMSSVEMTGTFMTRNDYDTFKETYSEIRFDLKSRAHYDPI